MELAPVVASRILRVTKGGNLTCVLVELGGDSAREGRWMRGIRLGLR